MWSRFVQENVLSVIISISWIFEGRITTSRCIYFVWNRLSDIGNHSYDRQNHQICGKSHQIDHEVLASVLCCINPIISWRRINLNRSRIDDKTYLHEKSRTIEDNEVTLNYWTNRKETRLNIPIKESLKLTRQKFQKFKFPLADEPDHTGRKKRVGLLIDTRRKLQCGHAPRPHGEGEELWAKWKKVLHRIIEVITLNSHKE